MAQNISVALPFKCIDMRDSAENIYYSMHSQGLERSRSVSEVGSQQPPSLLTRTSSLNSASSAPIIKRNSSINSYQSSAQVPPSALRVGKYDVSGSNRSQTSKRSLLDLSIIYDVFGEDATLYGVLGVKSNADDSDIRAAYLSQGRETLLSANLSVAPDDTPPTLDEVPPLARKRFQAISVAYQILSTPDMKRDYDAWGVVCAPADSAPNPTYAPADSAPNPTIKRQSSIRWNPLVEERVITDADPLEHSHRSKSSRLSRNPGADGWLESHLFGLDTEAEKILNGSFKEGFDESLVSLQESLGSMIRGVGSMEFASDNATAAKTDDEDCLVQGIVDDVIPVAIEESKPQNKKMSFLKKLRGKKNLSRKEPQRKVKQRDKKVEMVESPPSPCSVLMCFDF